ncbi:MAG: hypothetical protein NTW46_01920 [Candidatus Nealsonbacteria bacterium]|nr:hypothetical protein [Candidatus Nealsonbacteria bacterium]
MNLKKIEFKAISKKIWEVFVFFAKHIVLSCFLVVLISAGAGFFIFYRNIALVNQENLGSMDSSLDIKKNYYDQIIKAWNEESERKEDIDSKSFTNIFYSIPKPSPEKPLPSPAKPLSSPSPSPEKTPQ